MIVKLLTEHHLKSLSLKGGCKGSSESTLFKMPHCWKSHVTAQLQLWQPSCSAVNSIGNCGRVHYGKHLYEIILNLDQRFRSRRRLNIFLICIYVSCQKSSAFLVC